MLNIDLKWLLGNSNAKANGAAVFFYGCIGFGVYFLLAASPMG